MIASRFNFNKFLDIVPNGGSVLFTFFYMYIRRKYWNRENFRPPFFDGFTRFGMS